MVNVASKRENGEKRKIVREAIGFLGRWGLGFMLVYFLLAPFETHLQSIEANHVRGVLELVGVNTTPTLVPFQFFMNGKLIEISALCAGLLEMVLLASAMFATRGETARAKVGGIIVGVGVLYAFNILRMSITLLQLEHSSLSFAVITHDFLFRFILIVGFAFLYGAWLHRTHLYDWASRKGWV
jgi:exosortase/archaeosortase family protein